MAQGAGENGMGGKGGGMQAPPSPYSYSANRPAMTASDYSGAANLPRLGDVKMQSDLGQQSRDFVAQFASSRNPEGAYFRPAPVQPIQPIQNFKAGPDIFRFLPGNILGLMGRPF